MLTYVEGGDVEYDLTAQHAADAAGRVPPDARTPTAASLFAASTALDVLAADRPRPVVLRFSDEGARAVACGGASSGMTTLTQGADYGDVSEKCYPPVRTNASSTRRCD